MSRRDATYASSHATPPSRTTSICVHGPNNIHGPADQEITDLYPRWQFGSNEHANRLHEQIVMLQRSAGQCVSLRYVYR